MNNVVMWSLHGRGWRGLLRPPPPVNPGERRASSALPCLYSGSTNRRIVSATGTGRPLESLATQFLRCR